MDRAHRIGQTKQVYVFRFITQVCRDNFPLKLYADYLTGRCRRAHPRASYTEA
jgi:hypothetical protein